jgi:hypothetical protein
VRNNDSIECQRRGIELRKHKVSLPLIRSNEQCLIRLTIKLGLKVSVAAIKKRISNV